MTGDGRPDPEALLDRLSAVAERDLRSARARLKVFFGAAPGVGKTYAMLESARTLARSGVDVVVGWVDTHGREETAALSDTLETLPRRSVAHLGATLEELDLEATLARRPRVVLIDELAHTNAPGSRHQKRWQDVLDVLDAGIEVHTTLNVQHIESLNDVVAQITGVKVRETVPDAVLERADEIALIDLPPDVLTERLREGKVYVPEQARRALENFFQRGNLLALRELALRYTAEHVDADVLEYRREQGIRTAWPARERILVCVGASPGSARLIRAGRRMADSLDARWVAAYVAPTSQPPLGARDRERLEAHLRLAESLGAEVVRLGGARVADELLDYARRHNVTRIVTGKPTHSRWRDRLRGSLLDEMIRGSGDIELHMIAGTEGQPRTPEERTSNPPPPFAGWAAAVALVAATTGLGALLDPIIGLPDTAMLFLLSIVLASFGGRGPALLAAGLAVASFNFFFVPPRLTFAVTDTRHVVTFGVMIAISFVTSDLIERLKRQERAARVRERRTAAVLQLTQELADVTSEIDAAVVLSNHLGEVLAGSVAVLIADSNGALTPAAGLAPLSSQEETVADWVAQHGRPAGQGTDTLPGAQVYCAPMQAERPVGVVLVQRRPKVPPLDVEQRHLIELFSRQTALTIERFRLEASARDAAMRARTEELRSTLLSSVSHDLRTPLATITGAASALRAHGDRFSSDDRTSLLDSVVDEAGRLERILGNVLQLTRLEAGAQIARQWVPIEELIGPVLDRLGTALAGRTVAVDLSDDLPLVAVDPVLIDQALTNLVENALRYSPVGSPLSIAACRSNGTVRLKVADRGPGIPVGQEERLFEKFWRGEAKPSGAGAGLGLAITRAIASAHAGRIFAANREGGGAVFTLELPAIEVPPEVPDETRGAAGPDSVSPS